MTKKVPLTPKAYAEYLYCYPLTDRDFARIGVEGTAVIQMRIRAFLDGVRWSNKRRATQRRRVNSNEP